MTKKVTKVWWDGEKLMAKEIPEKDIYWNDLTMEDIHKGARMTIKEIFEMARQAGFEGCAELTWEDVICTEELVAFAKLVAEKEREACAKICEGYSGYKTAFCALKIRARGKE